MATITTKADEASVAVSVTCSDSSGAVDLTGVSEVRLFARRRGASSQTINTTLTPDGDQTTNTGVAAGTLTAANLALPGIYRAEIKVTWPGGMIRKFPNTGNLIMEIIPDIDLT